MNPEQALDLLAKATEPGAQITRSGYCQIESALVCLSNVVVQYKELLAAQQNEKASKVPKP